MVRSRDIAQHHNIIERKAMISLQMKNIAVCVVLFNQGTFIVMWHVLKHMSTRNP